MEQLLKTLAANMAAVSAKQTAFDNAEKNMKGASDDLQKALAAVTESYAAVATAVGAVVPGIAQGGRSL